MMMISPILLMACMITKPMGFHTVLSTLLHNRQDPSIQTKRVTQGSEGLRPTSINLQPSVPGYKLLTKPKLPC